jgi:hypothetical protein
MVAQLYIVSTLVFLEKFLEYSRLLQSHDSTANSASASVRNI